MVKVVTREEQFGKIIKITDKDNAFEIIFGANGDLYFRPCIEISDLPEYKEPIIFQITKEDGFLYQQFDKLYKSIIRYQPFENIFDIFNLEEDNTKEEIDPDEYEYQKRKDQFREYPLVQDKTISWRSDENPGDVASILNITKDDETICLEFIKNKVTDLLMMSYSIRFSNSGSRYDPYNCRFMDLYNNLCAHYKSDNKEKSVVLEKIKK